MLCWLEVDGWGHSLDHSFWVAGGLPKVSVVLINLFPLMTTDQGSVHSTVTWNWGLLGICGGLPAFLGAGCSGSLPKVFGALNSTFPKIANSFLGSTYPCQLPHQEGNWWVTWGKVLFKAMANWTPGTHRNNGARKPPYASMWLQFLSLRPGQFWLYTKVARRGLGCVCGELCSVGYLKDWLDTSHRKLSVCI